MRFRSLAGKLNWNYFSAIWLNYCCRSRCFQ